MDDASRHARLRELLARPRPDFLWHLPAERVLPQPRLIVLSSFCLPPHAQDLATAVAMAKAYAEDGGEPLAGHGASYVIYEAVAVVGAGPMDPVIR